MDYERILQTLRPIKKPNVENTLLALRKAAEKEELSVEILIGGSYAKNTMLGGAHDIDVFVRFDYEQYKDVDLAELLEKIVPKDAERLHGSRDYFLIKREGFVYEIVPVLHVNDWKRAKNVTDMSPLHVDYVKQHLAEKPSLADDIRLAKQWCKANKLYGAESYIAGLSGHVLDLLLIHYRSFDAFIFSASQWGAQTIIDLEGHHKDPLRTLNASKLHSPLIIVDPLQPERNAAAALSPEMYDKVRASAKAFIEDPQEDMFSITNLHSKDILAQHPSAIIIDIQARPGKNDVMGAKCKASYQYLCKQLTLHDFTILETDWEFKENKAIAYWVLVDGQITAIKKMQGPPLKEKKACTAFKEKHPDAFEKGGRLYAKVTRKYTNVRTLLNYLFTQEPITSRTRSITLNT